ncbi:MAG TPA: NAD(P)H-dependent oxidoreductase [Bacilli bacterium]|jgi:putative NADPH-quinone reductase|nr:NAD(P)H-dependent oxidoreductase [Bacilli bacterium]HOC81162.1 NAD(P)H-dependent oxidoreductase [Bacilli bacterium]
MKTTILLAHPWHGSFNKAIFDTVVNKLTSLNKPYQIIDLNKDGFNPVMTEKELALFSRGQFSDPLVGKYQKMLAETDELVVIFPIWWGDSPAILKGFIDKVMLKGFAYDQGESGLIGKLTHIKKGYVITTSETPTFIYKEHLGNPIDNIFVKIILESIGIKDNVWINKDMVFSGGQESRVAFLKEIAHQFDK